jgi:hypothetical protein
MLGLSAVPVAVKLVWYNRLRNIFPVFTTLCKISIVNTEGNHVDEPVLLPILQVLMDLCFVVCGLPYTFINCFPLLPLISDSEFFLIRLASQDFLDAGVIH